MWSGNPFFKFLEAYEPLLHWAWIALRALLGVVSPMVLIRWVYPNSKVVEGMSFCPLREGERTLVIASPDSGPKLTITVDFENRSMYSKAFVHRAEVSVDGRFKIPYLHAPHDQRGRVVFDGGLTREQFEYLDKKRVSVTDPKVKLSVTAHISCGLRMVEVVREVYVGVHAAP